MKFKIVNIQKPRQVKQAFNANKNKKTKLILIGQHSSTISLDSIEKMPLEIAIATGHDYEQGS